jgi:hypothetical protein
VTRDVSDTGPTRDHYLGVYRQPAGLPPEFEGSIQISAVDYERYSNAVAEVSGLAERRTLKMVEHNHLELEELRGYYQALFGLKRELRLGQLDLKDATFNLMAAVINWLSSFRLYLDHQETLYKRKFGDSSPQIERFKHACRNAYDGSAAYRIISRFRNYVQHCGMPISNVAMQAPTDKSYAQEVVFGVSRATLLTDFDWTARVREDLENQPSTIDIFDLIDETMVQLRLVAQEVLEIDTAHALSSVPSLREAVDRLGSIDGAPILVSFEGDPAASMQVSPTPFVTVTDVERLEAARDSADPVRFLSTQVDRPPMPAPFSDAQNDRNARAIALLSKWFEQGGSTADYHRFANELLAADPSVEPLLSGLVFVSSYALGLAAGALGVTRESLLGGLDPSTGRQP